MVSTLALLLRGVALIVPKPSEEDILHFFGVIGAQTSQPDPNQTYQNRQDPTAQEILNLRYNKPQRKFSISHTKSSYPKFPPPNISEFFYQTSNIEDP